MRILSKKNLQLAIFTAACLFTSDTVMSMDKPLIFPIPQQLQVTNESFVLDETILIVTPKNASEKDVALARLLVKELSNKYGIALKIQSVDAIPRGRKVVMMGTLSNPLIKKYCSDNHIAITKQHLGTEGYILNVTNNLIVIGITLHS